MDPTLLSHARSSFTRNYLAYRARRARGIIDQGALGALLEAAGTFVLAGGKLLIDPSDHQLRGDLRGIVMGWSFMSLGDAALNALLAPPDERDEHLELRDALELRISGARTLLGHARLSDEQISCLDAFDALVGRELTPSEREASAWMCPEARERSWRRAK